ncbi:MAG: hypothetical protein K2X48_15900 [Chitinophagaceae bacterium]|nr:hypothetical protein [Chitinophagaceae bacterium]
MKKIILPLLLLVSAMVSAQNQSTIIKTEALKMARALAAMDFKTYAAYTWPALVSDDSSKQKIKQGADSAAKYQKQFGLKVKSILIGNPSAVVKHKGVMQCTISQTTEIEAMMGSLSSENTLIGLSTDGKKWYFVEASLFASPKSKAKLPELSPKLVIPVQKKPVLKDANGKPLDIKQ